MWQHGELAFVVELMTSILLSRWYETAVRLWTFDRILIIRYYFVLDYRQPTSFIQSAVSTIQPNLICSNYQLQHHIQATHPNITFVGWRIVFRACLTVMYRVYKATDSVASYRQKGNKNAIPFHPMLISSHIQNSFNRSSVHFSCSFVHIQSKSSLELFGASKSFDPKASCVLIQWTQASR